METRENEAELTKKNQDLSKILIEIEAFDQMQTADRLRQWLENPERLPKKNNLIPKKRKRMKE